MFTYNFTLVTPAKTEFGYQFQACNPEMAKNHISKLCDKWGVSLKKKPKNSEA